MRRRDFVTLLGGAAVVWPLGVNAQEQGIPIIGYLSNGSPEGYAHLVAALRKGLSESGYVDGRNVTIEFRWANNQVEKLPELAADLARRKVALIVAVGSVDPAIAAKAATNAIPIVFANGGDPVAAGLVASFNRPGGNVTGVTGISEGLAGKQLGLLHEIAPAAKRIGVLVNPTDQLTESGIADVKAVASSIELQIEVVAAASVRDIPSAFASLAQQRVSALVVLSSPLFIVRRVQLAILSIKYAMPAIYAFRENAEAGGLLSYGPNTTEVNRQVGIYAARILKGEKPTDLPVMQAHTFEFVVNLQTAGVMGMGIPANVLARADAVIE